MLRPCLCIDVARNPGSPALSNGLYSLLRDRIRRRGPITFRDFMAAALYEPSFGYYSKGAGIGRDYLTSPDTHPLFGALLAGYVSRVWNALGRPEGFDVVELGAGYGALARTLLEALQRKHPDCFDQTRYTIVEISAELRRLQQRRLAGLPVIWGPLPRNIHGIVLSNELFDALPFHILTRTGEWTGEVLVGWDDGFTEVRGPIRHRAIRKLAEATGALPEDDQKIEVNLAAITLMRRIARSLARGCVLTIDYGYDHTDRRRIVGRNGTLLCYHRGSVTDTPYRHVGDQDITSHVDFTALECAGASAGLDTMTLTSQRQFLRGLGIDRNVAALRAGRIVNASIEENERGMRLLTSPSGLGGFKVLVQTRLVNPAALMNEAGKSEFAGSGDSTMPLINDQGEVVWSNE